MYKLVTNDSSTYALAILPFEGIIEKRGVEKKVLCLAFGAEIDTLAKVKEICNDELKMTTVTVYENSVQVRIENDYTVLEQITTAVVTNEDGEEVDVLMAKMSKSTSIPEQITNLENVVASLKDANAALVSANTSLTEKISSLMESNTELKESMSVVRELQNATSSNATAISAIKDQIGEVDENSLDIDTLKKYRVNMSKVNLATYLEENKVTSSAYAGVEAEYSMTQEKQSQLMAVIMMATLNENYVPSWNASGEVCTYDWTLDELQTLAADIEAVVRPLVAKQQTMEVAIMAAETIDSVKEVDITF